MVSTSTPTTSSSRPTHNARHLDRVKSRPVEQSRTTIPEIRRTLLDVGAARTTTPGTDTGPDAPRPSIGVGLHYTDIVASQDVTGSDSDLPENEGDLRQRLSRLGKRKTSGSSVETGGGGRSAAAIATGTESVVRNEHPPGKRRKVEIAVEILWAPTFNKDEFILVASSQASSQVSQGEGEEAGASSQSTEIPSSLPLGPLGPSVSLAEPPPPPSSNASSQFALSDGEQCLDLSKSDSEYVPSQELLRRVQRRVAESQSREDNEHDTSLEIPDSLYSGDVSRLTNSESDDRASQFKDTPGSEHALTTTRRVPSFQHVIQYSPGCRSQETRSSGGNGIIAISSSEERHTRQAAPYLASGSTKAISQRTIPDSQESRESAVQLSLVETSIVLPSLPRSPTKQPELTEQYRQVDPLELSSEGLPSGPGSTRGTSAPQSPSPSPSQVVFPPSTTASAQDSAPTNSSESKLLSDGYLTQEPFSHPLFPSPSDELQQAQAIVAHKGSGLQDAQVVPGAPSAEGSQGSKGTTKLLPGSVKFKSRPRPQLQPQPQPQLSMDQSDISMADHSAPPPAAEEHSDRLLSQVSTSVLQSVSQSHSLPHRRASLPTALPNAHIEMAFDLDTPISTTKVDQPSAPIGVTDSGFDIISFYTKEEERGRLEMEERLSKASRSQTPKPPSHADILPMPGVVPHQAISLYQSVAGALKAGNWTSDSIPGSIDPRSIFAGPPTTQASAQDSLLEDITSHTEPAVPTETTAPRSHLVTLPFVSGRRAAYIDVLKAYSDVAEAFSGTFEYVDKWPDAELARAVDGLFGKLLNICDLAGTHFTLRAGENEQRFRTMVMKHAMDSNTKFAFANLIMEQLAGHKVLVVARTKRILDIYESISQSLSPGPEVTLLLSEEEPPRALSYFDLIIAHDSKFKASPTAALASTPSGHAPTIISLVLEYGIDHLLDHMHHHLVRPSIPDLERKNGLLYMLGKSTSMLSGYSNSPLFSFPALQEAAIQLARQVTSPSESFLWTEMPIPHDWLDCYVESTWKSSDQPHDEEDLSKESGRKRKLDDEEMESAKRAKFINDLHKPAIPDDVSTLLQLDVPEGETENDEMISIPIAQLQAWVQRITDFSPEKLQKDVDNASREVIGRLEKQVTSYEATYKSVAKRYQDAIFDRSEFENKADHASKQLRTADTKIRALEDEIQTLKTRLDASQSASQPPAQSHDALQLQLNEANTKTARLEKMASTAEKELNFLRERYQDTTNEKNSVAAKRDALVQEAKSLRGQDHAVDTQRKQADSQTAQLLHHLRNKEYEIAVLRQDLGKTQERLAQEIMLRNSTRQTRQGSVPRSPAHRPVRGGISIPGGGIGHGGNGSGSSGHTSSRGVSPVAAVDHPRYSRLKD